MVVLEYTNVNTKMKSDLELHRGDVGSFSDYYSDNEPNDLDFIEVNRIAQYKEAITILQKRCETISTDNEKLVGRLHYVKRLTKRKEKDVALLKAQLDEYNDGWRIAQPELPPPSSVLPINNTTKKNNSCVNNNNKKEKKPKVRKTVKKVIATPTSQSTSSTTLPTLPSQITTTSSVLNVSTVSYSSLNKSVNTTIPISNFNKLTPSVTSTFINNQPLVASAVASQPSQQHQQSQILPSQLSSATAVANPASNKTATKRRRTKTDKEKDPNAPKRPVNAFFQYCQEQRSVLMGELNSELKPGESELSKQELTRQLAYRWRAMDNNNKQVYINKYEDSKQKYNEEMRCYKKEENNT